MASRGKSTGLKKSDYMWAYDKKIIPLDLGHYLGSFKKEKKKYLKM